MRDIPIEMREESRRIATGDSWIPLVDVDIDGRSHFRMTSNAAEVVFRGDTYQPFPITWEAIQETLRGDLPFLRAGVSNVTGEVGVLVNRNRGLMDRPVNLLLVNSGLLADPTAAIEYLLFVRRTVIKLDSVIFDLSLHRAILEKSFPGKRLKDRCGLNFKDPETCQFGFDNQTLFDSSSFCDKGLDTPHGCFFHGALEAAAAEPVIHPEKFSGLLARPRRKGP